MAMYDATPTSLTAVESPITDPARSALRQWGIIKNEIQVRPLCRDDLKQLIKKLGQGKAEGIDLSCADMRGIDLRGMDLRKAILKGCNLEGAIAMPMLTQKYNEAEVSFSTGGYEEALNMWHDTGKMPDWVGCVKPTILSGALLNLANLSYGDFRWAKLDGAVMTRCNLTCADLSHSDLSGAWLNDALVIDADLISANLQDSDIIGASISSRTRLENIHWGKKNINKFEREGKYQEAIAQYSQLVKWHELMGLDEMAGHFNYRGRECQRKNEWKSLINDFRIGWEKIWRKKKPQ